MIHYFTLIVIQVWKSIYSTFASFLILILMEQFQAVKILHTVVLSCAHIRNIGPTSYSQYRSQGSCIPSPVCLSVRSSVAGPSPDERSGSSA